MNRTSRHQLTHATSWHTQACGSSTLHDHHRRGDPNPTPTPTPTPTPNPNQAAAPVCAQLGSPARKETQNYIGSSVGSSLLTLALTLTLTLTLAPTPTLTLTLTR